MHRKPLLKSLILYKNSTFFTSEEEQHHKDLVSFVTDNPGCFEREHEGHVTGSVWLVNHEKTHVLLTHHKKLNLWLQLGGHADGDPDVPRVALKEAHEESGIEELEFIHSEIFDIDIHPIPNKCKFHYDVRYLIKAGPNAQYIVSHESHDLKWVALDTIEEFASEPSLIRMAHKMQLIK